MGNREKLLEGAKRCLYERGHSRTTARDIVAASGANLASIGYHYGSKEALLDAAVMEALGEWGEELEGILAAGTDEEEGADPMARFESTWARVVGSFGAHRPALIASFEAFARAERSPEVRERIAAGHERARWWLAGLLGGTGGAAADGEEEAAARWAVGSFWLALLNGLMVQWLLDPGRAPTGGDLAEALRRILETVGPEVRRYTPPSA